MRGFVRKLGLTGSASQAPLSYSPSFKPSFPVTKSIFGGGAAQAAAVIYDGDYLKHTLGPAGAVDGLTGTVVWAGTFNSDGSAMSLLRAINGSGTVLSLRRTATNTIEFKGWQGDATTAVFSNVSAAVAKSLGFLIILASFNGTFSTLKIIHAGGTITGTITPGTSGNIEWTSDLWLGQDGASGEYLDADTSMWWLDDAEIDFTSSNNIEQFWDTTLDRLRDPGADGSNPVDGAYVPLVCHVNPAASHAVNRGSGGNADVASTFESGTSPGAYSPDYVIPPATIAYVAGSARSNSTVSVISYTFNNVPIGTAAADRIVAVSVHTETVSITGVTLDGNAMTAAIQVNNSNVRAEIYYLAFPTGTTGDIVVTLSSASGNACGITVHEINNATATPTDTDSSIVGSSPFISALTIPVGGVGLCALQSNNTGATFVWTNATETVDQEISFRSTFSAAIIEAAGTPTITATVSGTPGSTALAAAAWGP